MSDESEEVEEADQAPPDEGVANEDANPETAERPASDAEPENAQSVEGESGGSGAVETEVAEPGDGADAESQADAEAEADVEPGEKAEAEDEGLQDGDFIRLDYTARTVEDGQLVDTTDQEVAEEEEIADEGTFEPRVVVIGAGHLFGTVEQDLTGKEAGDSGSVVVPAEEAFGEYDPDEVRTVSADKIPEDDRRPGAEVTIDGEQGYLLKIIGGRARVDFNHPLAGDDIEYEYEIVEEVTDELERARGLLNVFLDLDLEMHIQDDEVEEERVVYPDEDELDEDEEPEPETVTETVEKTTLYIEATPQLTWNQQWMYQKQQVAQEIMRRTNIDRIIVQEILDGGGGMGGLGGMMGGAAEAELEEALEESDIEDTDIDADELVEELEAGAGDEE